MKSGNFKIWRDSATLILAARSPSDTNINNYKVLCMKRSSKSEFMPNTYVFPGGAISKSDSSTDWLKLYEKFGFNRHSFNCFEPTSDDGKVPEIFQHHLQQTDALPSFLSLRICAIRETFEECGILLCKSPQREIHQHDFSSWQHKVHDNSNEFFNLCTQIGIYPDVWALKTWSNWATPPPLPSLKFNTLFFLATLHQMPKVFPDEREVEDLMWATPDECIALNNKGGIILPIPQFYEISRLRTFSDVDSLEKFASQRSQHGCETYLPYRVKTKQGLFSLLPGDELYPDHIDRNDTELPFISELPESATQHRILHKSTNTVKKILITGSFTPKYNHLIPTCD